MHYYPHHIGDFMQATANLDDHQLATYLRMIWAYYDTEKPISLEIEDVAFAMRSDEKTVRLLLRHYFTETPDGWTHTRCEAEIANYRAKRDKAKIGASARWSNANAMRTHTERTPDAMQSVCDTNANQEPITNNQILTTLSSKLDVRPDFNSKAKNALLFLNEKSGRNYPPVEANLKIIAARMKEGFTDTQIRQVIVRKAREWGSNERMEKYIRPKTLFSRENFANYVGELVCQTAQTVTPPLSTTEHVIADGKLPIGTPPQAP